VGPRAKQRNQSELTHTAEFGGENGVVGSGSMEGTVVRAVQIDEDLIDVYKVKR